MMLFLWIACSTHRIEGTIQTPSQEPLADVTCKFLNTESTSSASGQFQFNDLQLKPGEYPIQCTKKGFEFYQDSIMVSGINVVLSPIIMPPLSVQIPYMPFNMDPEGSLLDK